MSPGYESLIGLAVIVLTAFFNGLVIYGVVKTELKYIRRDIDLAHARIDGVVIKLQDIAQKVFD
ncbi:MAG: hypothetical protein OEW37_07785 [Rhodospirillaceae bacterium]|nr:hypothetical protein [Rhodospirillaceae bacterium]